MTKITALLLMLTFSAAPAYAESAKEETHTKAVAENNYSVSLEGNWNDVDFYTLQADGTFGIGEHFGSSIGANTIFINGDSDSSDFQNLRASIFTRNPEVGRLELAYQTVFGPSNTSDYFSVTGEYYFSNWTIGAYFLSDDLSDLNDLNIYTNIYFTQTVRLEIDLLDSSDDSLVKGTIKFQLPEVTGNEWIFNVSYGAALWDNNQVGFGVTYVPKFNGSLKQYYRSYSTNIKAALFH
ncbi:hypothetical protein [Thalassotalea litorea]|uniref:hypothetical protein n=1 Tax=Thalassotalea litorea TaxID=2020715 RepID=UPI003735F962